MRRFSCALKQAILWLASCTAVVSLSIFQRCIAQSTETLDNAAVVQMVQAHLGTDIIVGQIQSNPGTYTLTTASLIKLKQQGVPDAVIAAMQKKSAVVKTEASSSTTPQKNRVYSPQGAAESWEPDIWTTNMTGEETPVIFTRVSGTRGGRFRVQAMCVNETWMEFLIENETANRSLRRTELARSVNSTTTEGLFGSSLETSSSIGPARSCVVASVRADAGGVKQMTSRYCDVGNQADLNFQGVISRQRYRQLLKEHPEANPGIAGALLDGLLGGGKGSTSPTEDLTLTALNMSNGDLRMAALLSASQVRIGLPFEDGGFSEIDLHPQQPEFRAYAAKCMSKASEVSLADNGPKPNGEVAHVGTPAPAVINRGPVPSWLQPKAQVRLARTFQDYETRTTGRCAIPEGTVAQVTGRSEWDSVWLTVPSAQGKPGCAFNLHVKATDVVSMNGERAGPVTIPTVGPNDWMISGRGLTAREISDPKAGAPATCTLPVNTQVSFNVVYRNSPTIPIIVTHPVGGKNPLCSNVIDVSRTDIKEDRSLFADSAPVAAAQPPSDTRPTVHQSTQWLKPDAYVRIERAVADPNADAPKTCEVPKYTMGVVDTVRDDGTVIVRIPHLISRDSKVCSPKVTVSKSDLKPIMMGLNP